MADAEKPKQSRRNSSIYPIMKRNFLFAAATAVTFILCCVQLQSQHHFQGHASQLWLEKYHAGPNGPRPVVTGDSLGGVFFWGLYNWPSRTYHRAAAIQSFVTGPITANAMPSNLAFQTGAAGLRTRMVITEGGNVGIGLTNPTELLDVNGNAILRGTRLSLGLGSPFANGGEALTHTSTNGFPTLPGDVLTINNAGGFAGGVYIDCPGLRVCGTMETECVRATRHVIADIGNMVALGGAAVTVNCSDPGEGDFISHGANGDFIAEHGHFIAKQGNITAQQGSISAEQSITSQNGDIRAMVGNVTAGNNISAGGNVGALNNLSAGGNLSVLMDGSIGNNLTVANTIFAGQKVSIGTINMPGNYRLYVADGILTERIKVALESTGDWADYVFDEDYQLKSLGDVEKFVRKNKHLPGLPSAEELSKEGVDLVKMDAKLLEKIEELTLYMIALEKQNKALQNEISELKKQVNR